MRQYANKRGWKITQQVKEVGSGAKTRPQREELLKAAWRREVDVIIVWRLDRWERSLADLVITFTFAPLYEICTVLLLVKVTSAPRPSVSYK
jgi:DNA invertase Pin-like site-specific DNA recombinase